MASNLAHRAWHALPKSIKGGDGLPGNVIVGFLNMLIDGQGEDRSHLPAVAMGASGTVDR
jgi:5'-3' exonuclease